MLRHRRLTVGIVAAAAIGAATAVGIVVAQSTGRGTVDELTSIADAPDLRVVAVVNGEEIYARDVAAGSAWAKFGGVTDSAGRPIDGKTSEEILATLVDERLLAQVAEKAGVKVSEDDVSLAIQSGIIDPYKSDDVPQDYKDAVVEALRIVGATVDSALGNQEVRAAYRRFLLIRMHSGASDEPVETRLDEARSTAVMEIVPENLPTPGGEPIP